MPCRFLHLALEFWFLDSNFYIEKIACCCYDIDIFVETDNLINPIYMNFSSIVRLIDNSWIDIKWVDLNFTIIIDEK